MKFERIVGWFFVIVFTCFALAFAALFGSLADIGFGSECVIASGVIDLKSFSDANGRDDFRVSVKDGDTYYVAQMKTRDWIECNVGDRATVRQRQGRFFKGVFFAERDAPK